ncbi:MAG: PQQ-binding-like beta-propeller repeat protein [Planctomycetales bacterium]|nr:PQQ-binding-like beta-propeller repeat protein [Planctomycetales bacterium]
MFNPKSLTMAARLFVVIQVFLTAGCNGTGAGPAATAQDPNSDQPLGKTVLSANPQVNTRRELGEDWATFLGPRGDGTSSETGLDLDRWQPHPPLKWILPLGVSYGGPAVADGRLFQFDRFGDAERLTCYEAETARELWRWELISRYSDMYGYNNGPRCAPIVDGDRVYTYGVTGQLSCVEVATGKALWTRNTVNDYQVVQNFFGVASSPVVYENLILVMVGGSPLESHSLPAGQLGAVRPNGTAIVAFDKLTGQEVYHLGDDLASYSSLAIRQLADRPTGLAFCRNGLIAWDPQTGEQIFTFPWRSPQLESVNAAQPVTTDSQILVSEAYDVGSVLLDVQDGSSQVVWQDGGPRNSCKFRAHWSTPVLIDGYLYGCNGRNTPDTDFRCVRFSDGQVMWTNKRRERSSVLSVDGYLLVLGEYGLLELIRPNPQMHEVVKQVDLSELVDPNSGVQVLAHPCWAAPVLSHGLLYIRGNENLVCFDLIPQ